MYISGAYLDVSDAKWYYSKLVIDSARPAVSETKILNFYVLFYGRWFSTRKMKRFTLDIWPTISSDSK